MYCICVLFVWYAHEYCRDVLKLEGARHYEISGRSIYVGGVRRSCNEWLLNMCSNKPVLFRSVTTMFAFSACTRYVNLSFIVLFNGMGFCNLFPD